MIGVIFDLDQTLVDSRAVGALRAQRRWADVYRALGQVRPYPGMGELLSTLRQSGISVCIVTSAPRPYCERLMRSLGWEVSHLVCYHDTQHKKPHPEPMWRALELLGLSADLVVAVGDDPRDIAAANAAEIHSVAAVWGASDANALLASQPDGVCHQPESLASYLLNRHEEWRAFRLGFPVRLPVFTRRVTLGKRGLVAASGRRVRLTGGQSTFANGALYAKDGRTRFLIDHVRGRRHHPDVPLMVDAEAGGRDAQLWLGLLYLFSKDYLVYHPYDEDCCLCGGEGNCEVCGQPEDPVAEAKGYLELAAEQGCAEAQSVLRLLSWRERSLAGC